MSFAPIWDSGGCRVDPGASVHYCALVVGDGNGQLFRVSFDGRGIEVRVPADEAVKRFWATFGRDEPYEKEFKARGWIVLGQKEATNA
jgi:hypothetical protein